MSEEATILSDCRKIYSPKLIEQMMLDAFRTLDIGTLSSCKNCSHSNSSKLEHATQ
jgi:hypothetical protein